MEKMQNLQDLLNHEIEDLYSAEDQITSALPTMIEKARNSKLKQALTQHLRVTEEQIRRLDKIKELLNQNKEESKGFLGGLFGGGNHKCKGMEGIIEEGEKIMKEDMDPDVMDAAIIASSQKIEHYEICGYGTARAFARELKLTQVERLLTETLNEEYDSDDKLTNLAVVGGLNEEAKDRSKRRSSKGQGNASGSRSKAGKSATKSASRGSAAKSASKSTSRASKSASKSSSRSASKASKSSGSKKSASKSSARPAARAGSSRSKTASKSRSKTASKSRTKAASKGRSKVASKGGKKSASKGRR